jgi:hypothetical protein
MVMKHTIEKMNHKLMFLNYNKKLVSYNGYAFIDECGHCIIIAYGENRRDEISKYLNGLLPSFNG